MKTLIIFSSKYGSTKKCAELIMKGLKDEVNIINLKNEKCKNIDNYDTVIICGAIYAGKLHGEVRKFIEDNKKYLLEKNLGLFICCKEEKEKVIEYMKDNIPDLIIQKAFIKEHLGHEINLEKMNFLEKFLLKNIFKVKESYSEIHYDAIRRIANKINEMSVTNG